MARYARIHNLFQAGDFSKQAGDEVELLFLCDFVTESPCVIHWKMLKIVVPFFLSFECPYLGLEKLMFLRGNLNHVGAIVIVFISCFMPGSFSSTSVWSRSKSVKLFTVVAIWSRFAFVKVSSLKPVTMSYPLSSELADLPSRLEKVAPLPQANSNSDLPIDSLTCCRISSVVNLFCLFTNWWVTSLAQNSFLC